VPLKGVNAVKVEGFSDQIVILLILILSILPYHFLLSSSAVGPK